SIISSTIISTTFTATYISTAATSAISALAAVAAVPAAAAKAAFATESISPVAALYRAVVSVYETNRVDLMVRSNHKSVAAKAAMRFAAISRPAVAAVAAAAAIAARSAAAIAPRSPKAHLIIDAKLTNGGFFNVNNIST